MLRVVPGQVRTDWTGLIDEWACRFFEETDYEREAANALAFQAQMADIEGIVVPEVFLQYTSREVLMTRWVQGQPCILSHAFLVHYPIAGCPSQLDHLGNAAIKFTGLDQTLTWASRYLHLHAIDAAPATVVTREVLVSGHKALQWQFRIKRIINGYCDSGSLVLL